MNNPHGPNQPDSSWGSHLVPLMACVCATRGAILECGVGDWSTPLLHAYCAAGGRRLVSLDEDRQWVERFAPMRSSSHEVSAVRYDAVLPGLAEQDWSVVLLDQSPGWRRAKDALMFMRAEFIVVHDYSGAEVTDPFAPILDQWPRRAIAMFSPSTLVLSNGGSIIPAFDKQVGAGIASRTSA